MKYDFTSLMNRSGHDSIAVDQIPIPGAEVKEGFSRIPMWVADMNFPSLPTIQEAIHARVNEPHFGYFDLPDAYFDSIIRWQKERNGVEDLPREAIGYENGVLGCVASAAAAFTSPGESILLHSPTYIGFTGVLENCGRNIVLSDLVQDENGVWRMDYADMDRKLKEHNIHFAIFCSPHNPTGRVWEREEIEKAMEIYKANECVVISDEIWSDLILPGNHHTPTQSVSEDASNRTIAFYAPTKTFNLAGLVGSYHIVYNKYLRDRLISKAEKTEYNSMNVLSMHALIGAYRPEGYEWVDELCQVIDGNMEFACNYIREHFEGVRVSRPQGTYMLFVDFEGWCQKTGKSMDQLIKAGWDVGVAWQDGRPFHGEYSIRINLALPLSRVKEAFDRLDQYVINA